ncbi:MAG: hypothetical protein KatS3mg008_1174 [Acidimicrobiales bacterium]|nr:MAG: hypothetical protein KatS3mg008_1174 [Acidimicrobiales bacterium]
MGQYLPVIVMAVLAIAFAGISRFVSGLLAPRRPTPAKLAPYECGIVPDREPPERFPAHFYLVAMIFVVFDIEVIFFLPWAVVQSEVGVVGLVGFVIFGAALFESFVYLISKGALAWGPLPRRLRTAPTVPVRTLRMSVRLVGPDGSVRRVGAGGARDDVRADHVERKGVA